MRSNIQFRLHASMYGMCEILFIYSICLHCYCMLFFWIIIMNNLCMKGARIFIGKCIFSSCIMIYITFGGKDGKERECEQSWSIMNNVYLKKKNKQVLKDNWRKIWTIFRGIEEIHCHPPLPSPTAFIMRILYIVLNVLIWMLFVRRSMSAWKWKRNPESGQNLR